MIGNGIIFRLPFASKGDPIGDSACPEHERIAFSTVFDRSEYAIFILLSLFSSVGILRFAFRWISSSQDWVDQPIFYGLLSAFLLITIFSYLGRWFLMPLMRTPQPLFPLRNLRVAVVTSFV